MSTSASVGGSVPPPIPISLDYVFGLKGDVKNNIHFLDDNTVLYPAGYNVVIYNTEKKTQKFIALGSPDHVSSCDISSMALLNSNTLPNYSHSNNAAASSALSSLSKSTRLLAVAERGERNNATVTVMDLQSMRKKTRYVLSSPGVNSSEFVSLAFSSDGKYLLTQGGGPDWTLVHWMWDKGKVLQTARVSNSAGGQITQVSYCPVDSNVICVTGNGILRFLHCEDNEMRAINVSMEGCAGTQHYTCHCWIEERVLIATDTGDILLFENAEFIGALACAPGDGKSIEVLCPYSKGFIAGCDEGVLYVYACDDKQYYSLAKSFQIENNLVKIQNISVSPSEEHIVVTLENDQSFLISLSLATATTSSTTSNASALLSVDELNIAPLTPPCHFQAVLGMSACARKPLIATCGLDRSVRIWNYISKQLQLLQFFSEQPLCICLHPTGLQLLVGFADGVRVFSVLLDTLKCVYQYPVKACREIQISNGGQYFAVANGSVVQIYAFYTFELLGSFALHRGRVRSLHWSPDDSVLTTAAADGYTYSFKVTSSAVTASNNNAGGDFPLVCSYKIARGHALSAVSDPDTKGTVYISASDMRVRVLKDSECVAQQQHTLTINTMALASNVQVQQPASNNAATASALGLTTNTSTGVIPGKASVLFGGSDVGILRCFMLPLSSVCFDVQCHSAPITRVLVSPCGSYIFTCGEDGLVSVFSIGTNANIGVPQAGNTSLSSPNTNNVNGIPWSEEVLVGHDDLVEQENKIQELQQRVDRMVVDNETLFQQKRLYFQERRVEMERKFESELADTMSKLKELDEQRRKSESWFAYRVEQLAQHQEEKLKAQEILYTDKVNNEKQRCEEMIQELANEREEIAAEEAEFLRKCEEEKQALIQKYTELIEKEKTQRQDLINETQRKATEYGILKQAIEDDVDEEIDTVKSSFDGKFIKERATTLKLRDNNTVQQQKFNELRNIVQRELQELKYLKAKQEQLYSDVNELNQEIHINIRELHERDATMKDKVDRLAQLKKKSQELEKFKFVLDSKLHELQRQLSPRREEMANLRSQVLQMQKELQQYQRAGNELQLHVGRWSNKLRGLMTETENVKAQKKLLSNRIKAFKMSIQEVLGSAVHACYRIQQDMKMKTGSEVAGDVEAALGAIAQNTVHQQELSTVTKQIKHGLRHIYQQHVLNVDEKELLDAQKAMLAYKQLHKTKEEDSDEEKDEKSPNKSNHITLSKKELPKTTVAFGTSVGAKIRGSSASVAEERSDYERERGYLERCVDSLVSKGEKGEEMRKRERSRIMRENVILIEEINELRRELQMTRLMQRKKNGQAVGTAEPETNARDELEKTLSIQQEQIRALKNHIMVLEAQEAELNK